MNGPLQRLRNKLNFENNTFHPIIFTIVIAYLLPSNYANFAFYLIIAGALYKNGADRLTGFLRDLFSRHVLFVSVFIAVSASLLAQAPASSDPQSLLRSFVSLLLILCLVYVVHERAGLSVRQIALAIAITSSVSIIANLALQIGSGAIDQRFSFILGKGRHPNQAACLITIGLLSLCYLWIVRERLQFKDRIGALLWAAGILHVIALGMTVSRGPLFSAAAFVIAFLAHALIGKRSFAPYFFAAVTAAAAASVVAVLYGDLITSLLCKESEGICRGGGRADIWQWAVAEIAGHPWIGNGPAFRFEPRAKGHAHNAYLGMAMHFGIPALLAFLAFLASVASRAFGDAKTSTETAFLLSVLGFGLAAMFTDLAHPMSFFGAHYLYLWLPLALLASRGPP